MWESTNLNSMVNFQISKALVTTVILDLLEIEFYRAPEWGTERGPKWGPFARVYQWLYVQYYFGR